MSKRTWMVVALGCVGLVVLAVGWPTAEATTPSNDEVIAAHSWSAQEPAYEGGRTACRRCHIREYRAWEATPHAHALETLMADSGNTPECVKCHVTGLGDASGFTSVEETPDLANVTCEVCHGPGSIYKDRETMEDRDASIAAGLTLPDEATCLGCHNDESPNYPGTFVYEEMLKNGVHEISR